MEAMCHTPRERKSKSLDKVRERKTKNKEKKLRKGHVTRRKVGGNFPLESSWRFGGGEGKMRERKRNKRKERRRKEE